MQIIQHHEPVDFFALFEEQQRQQIGPDFNQFDDIIRIGNDIHSFIGSSDGEDRVYKSLNNALENDEAKAIIDRAEAILFCVVFSPTAPHRLEMDELAKLFDFAGHLSDEVDITLTTVKDESLANVVKIYALNSAR